MSEYDGEWQWLKCGCHRYGPSIYFCEKHEAIVEAEREKDLIDNQEEDRR